MPTFEQKSVAATAANPESMPPARTIAGGSPRPRRATSLRDLSRPPDYVIKAVEKIEGQSREGERRCSKSNRVGTIQQNKDGSLHFDIDLCCVLQRTPGVSFIAFPISPQEQEGSRT